MKKKHKGITLIVLIITIIIMLILVGVSIQLVVNSGLFETAKNATKGTQDKAREEASLGSEIVIDGKTYASIEDYIELTKPLPEGAGKRATTTKDYTDNRGKTAVIPEGFTVSGVPSEAIIDRGLVIYLIDDKTDEEIAEIDWTDGTTVANLQTKYDQFVWIPIARENINDMYMCQSEDGTKSCNIAVQEVEGENVAYCTTHSSTQMAGRLYATTYGENFNSSLTTQTYTANSGLREPDVVTDSSSGNGTSYDNKDTYLGYLNGILGTNFVIKTDSTHSDTSDKDFKAYLQEEYNDIVKSVYENQGFYVGRYETSNVTTTDGTAIKVVAGTTPGNSINWYYMYAQQKDYATNKGLTNVVGSTMIQGAAYDQVMKFVNTASYSVTTGGNVGHGSSYFTTKPYQTGGRDYSTNYSGTTAYNDVSKNIYDLEGNVFAWTTEAISTNRRVFRAGNYLISYSASCRFSSRAPSVTLTDIGSVSQLYVTLEAEGI